jgi:hypothetical protein
MSARTRLAGNRYEVTSIDLKPDTYRPSGGKVLIGSFRDEYLNNFGQTTIPYDPETTREINTMMMSDAAIQDSTFTWRDWDGHGQIRAQAMMPGGDSAAPAMLWGVGPSPSKASQRIQKIWNLGSFNTSYKKDSTMVKPYSADETGLSMSVDIDHSLSPQERLRQSSLAHMRRSNTYQMQRKKADSSQVVSDDASSQPLGRSFSYNGSPTSSAAQSIQRHTRIGPGGTSQSGLEQNGQWKDLRTRNDEYMRRLRLGVDGYISYERNMHAPQVLDTGKRALDGGHGDGNLSVSTIRTDPETTRMQSLELGSRSAAHVIGPTSALMSNQEVNYDGRKVDELQTKLNQNMTIHTPSTAQYDYDNHKYLEQQTSKRAAADFMDRVERAWLIGTDASKMQETMATEHLTQHLKTSGPILAKGVYEIDPLDEQMVTRMTVAALSDPHSKSWEQTDTDMDAYYEQLTRLMPAADVPEFLTIVGKTVQSMQKYDSATQSGRAAANLKSSGSTVPDTVETIDKYDNRQTVNALSNILRQPGPIIANDALNDTFKFETRQEQVRVVANAPEHIYRDEGALEKQSTLDVDQRETQTRATRYGSKNNSRVEFTDMKQADSKLGRIMRHI